MMKTVLMEGWGCYSSQSRMQGAEPQSGVPFRLKWFKIKLRNLHLSSSLHLSYSLARINLDSLIHAVSPPPLL